ncbi:MAG: DUF2577 family protein, partial [Oscillospiraceae bacterium]|nr:DUF2577 family protein [Oscillospiraceae bacterium]
MLSDILKKIAAGAAADGSEILYGVVRSTEPLSVTVDSRFTLPEEVLVMPEGLETLKLRLVHDVDGEKMTKEILLRQGLKAGDKVILLAAGGQYL